MKLSPLMARSFMPDDKNLTTNPTFPDPQNQDVVQPSPNSSATGTTPLFSTENIETPPPPITLSQEEAQKNQEFPKTGPSVDIPPVVIAANEAKKYSLISKVGGKKMVATILGLLVLVGGLGAGVLLTRQNQDIREKAAGDGLCNVDSDANCALRAPGYACGEGQICQYVEGAAIDSDGRTRCECVVKQIKATAVPESTAVCSAIAAYTVTGDPATDNSTWTKITLDGSTDLEEGDIIYFKVSAKYKSSTIIDKAKFVINDIEQTEAIAKTPVCSNESCTIEFYQKYTIPSAVYDYTVTTKLHLENTDTWF